MDYSVCRWTTDSVDNVKENSENVAIAHARNPCQVVDVKPLRASA